MKYTLSDIARICGGKLTGVDHTVCSAATDSRSFSLGDRPLFVAIAGVNHDGHAYIAELYYRGVRAFMVERDVRMESYPEAGFVHVESAVVALQALAADYRSHFGGIVAGITGSNGKTVVKEWIAQLCPPGVKLFRSPKSYNSQIGVPLSVLMMEGDEQIVLIEAGISQPGEMARLERIVRPDVGIITTLGDAHQEHFRNLQHKLEEKLHLFRHARTIIYSSHYPQIEEQLLYQVAEAKRRSEDGVVPRLVDAAKNDLCCGFPDRASREDAALAVAFYDAMGYDRKAICARLGELQPVAMRLELKDGLNGSLIVNDSYNSDVNSLAIALDYLRSVAGERPQTLILSDILQSGYTEEELYTKVAHLMKGTGVDHLIGIGTHIREYASLFPRGSEFYPTTDAFLAAVTRESIAGRAILIKGNRSSQFERVSHALQLKSHTTMLEVDLDAMIHNLNVNRAKLKPNTRLMAMVKASSYGHGGYEIANMLQHQGVHYLAVAFADEGVALRERGISMPIVVLNADSDSFELMIAHRLEPEIYNFLSLHAFVDELRRHGERDYPIHIKLDTGMHRLGFVEKDIDRLLQEIGDCGHLVKVQSVFSHFAVSDEATEDEFTREQLSRFEAMSRRIVEALPYQVFRHIANSAAIERFPEAQYDMCRLGIGLYGVATTAQGETELCQVAVLKSRIVQIKELDSSQTVGYGRAGHLSRPTRTATVPIGYADGLDRHLGCGRWSFRVNGKPAPIVGRVCMDTCMVDVTDIECREGDEVIVYGGGPGNSVSDMARVLDTIPYEIMTSISTRVKRVYLKE